MTKRKDAESPPSSREVSDSLSKDQRILEVATDQFAAVGFAAVRIDKIAALAKCNKQLIYYYFGSKEDLYEAVLAKMVEKMASYWAETENLKLQDTLSYRFANLSRDVERWRRLLIWEGLEIDAEDGDELRLQEARTQSVTRQTETIRHAQDRGEIDPGIDPAMLTLFLTLMASGPAAFPQLTRMITGDKPNSPEFAARQNKFFRTLVNPITSARGRERDIALDEEKDPANADH